MTWLVGTSTWGTIVNDICKLACAEMSDSLGHAPTVAEKWVRDIDTGHNLLRMPASQDVDLAAVHQPAMRAGYWTLCSNPGVISGAAPNPPGSNPVASVCKMTTAPGSFTTTLGRLLVRIRCQTGNTAAGNYSTAVFGVDIYDPDSQTSSGWNLTPSAAGVLSIPAWLYTGFTVTVSDPSGFIQPGTWWIRGFTSAYPWGIDCWPMYPRASGVWTFATAPPGTAGTDYDIINQAYQFSQNQDGLTGANFSGLGCKTAAAANGARYVFASCPVTPLKVGLVAQSGVSGNGYIDLICFGVANDAVNGNLLRASGGSYLAQWLRLASSQAQVVASMTVQYWMSVTATGIVVVLNADPGYTGGMTDGYFGLFTPGSAYDANDKFQTFVSANVGGIWLQNNSGQEAPYFGYTDMSYFRQYRCQDGSAVAVRDWQTYWMRGDFMVNGSLYYQLGGLPLTYADLYSNWSGQGDRTQGSPYDTAKPAYDGNWWFYGFRLVEGITPITFGSIAANNESQAWPRGALNDRFWHLPGIGWANGDELTDTSNNAKYLCVMPDAPGLPGRMIYSNSGWRGGTAIAEL